MKKEYTKLIQGALFTDLYQLTMAQLFFRIGIHENIAQFDYFFRSYPDYGSHQAGYCIFAGLEWLVDWMQESVFGVDELIYLKTVKDRQGSRLFGDDFLGWLSGKSITEGITIRSVEEGRVVHPYVPNLMVEGQLAMAQILESSLLNQINFQTLIATKASRIHEIAQGKLVLEFGLRRAQSLAANAGARAALIGGADFTSNTGMSAALGYPPSGTHGHSMVQAIIALGGNELDAFRAFADVYPNNCILLVDTINTLESGIPNAIKVFEEMKKKGQKPLGIRLDSGDLAFLSIQAAKMLNQAGFPDTTIVLSNQIDELTIWQIITQIQNEADRNGLDAQQLIDRLSYGVGTKMITSSGASALDGVYKLTSIKDKGKWVPTLKISELPEKTLNPGHKSIWRIYDNSGKAISDLIALDDENPAKMKVLQLHHPTDPTKQRSIENNQISSVESLLTDILIDSKIIYQFPSIEQIRNNRKNDLERLYPGVKRLISPHIYHVSLSQKLWELKNRMVKKSINN